MTRTNRLHLKDARELTRVVDTSSPCVDVTITSPPYWNLKDYGAKNQIGHGQTKEEYLRDVQGVLADCLGITKPTGSLWLVVDTYREKGELRLLPLELAERARQAGWRLRDLIVWDKGHSVPWHRRGNLRNTSEFILFMTRTSEYKYYGERIKTLDEVSKWWVDFPERFNPKGKTPANIWSIPIRPRGRWRKPSGLNHFCSFPTGLVARIIELTTDEGDLVLDPFAGSGVVLAQAAAMGRRYLGFEVNEEYVRMFREVVKREVSAEWEELRSWRESQEAAVCDFEQTVMRLRALKYARQVTKPLVEARCGDSGHLVRAILCIASIPKEHESGRPFSVEIVAIADNNMRELHPALEKAKVRASRPPLTQYGIVSGIGIATYGDLKRQAHLADQTLYLYTKYKPREYAGAGPLSSWFEGGRLEELRDPSRVPLLANVAVDVAWVLDDSE